MKRHINHSLKSTSRRGFTLTELLIVMAILVLLVSMVGPRLLGSKQKADINAAKTQIGMFQSALERYAIDVNRFPNTEEGLDALVEAPGSSDDSDGESSGSTSWDGPYLKQSSLPSDPWGNSYGYEYPPKHSKGDQPEIWSYGPDGEEDTDDDILSWTGGRGGDDEGGDSFDDAGDDRGGSETTSTFDEE
ncbi:MAG: type II secretion system major pseudopilin GspG [Planctomycetaceae bacterium]|nr:type II secretion system major pseudopilin GspG [Planctomycetaceae bacterium]